MFSNLSSLTLIELFDLRKSYKNLNYSLVKLKSLTDRLEKLSNTNDQNVKNVCDRILQEFDYWYEDNPEALIITDYLEDI